ncbi:phage holin family protein [Allosediminivita pacifica]|uniref:Putative superfamily III holin-X n=1 Tax=Allosediminivita pacifica TaxID=1267769 RepID=A0A2T5ZYV4_9RHOB|nr:phage holin family protein [Allosediminivita pacifica]PTX36750.1 putative superfamily III holin-X [Allosediminivita pacifica]GGB30536.1 hypothetical protein GCM10011324_45070 [Allosediminivita pacifica]
MANTDTQTTDGTRRQIRDTGTLLSDALRQVIALIRGEMDLFRAELDQNVKKAGTALGLLVGGVVILLVALNVLAGAAVTAIAEAGLAPGWSALLVGGVLLILALILVKVGQGNLKLASLAPTRTKKNLERDRETVAKEMTNE